jgi:hypothetical protein
LARSSKSSGWMRGRATSHMHVVGVLEKKRVPVQIATAASHSGMRGWTGSNGGGPRGPTQLEPK